MYRISKNVQIVLKKKKKNEEEVGIGHRKAAEKSKKHCEKGTKKTAK